MWRTTLLSLGLLHLSTTDGIAATRTSRLARSAVRPRSVVVAHASCNASYRERRPTARANPIMGDDKGGIMDELKRRGSQLARDIADAAEAVGELLDDGLDVVLGPRPSPTRGLIPIPIPVEPDYPEYNQPRRGAYDDYGRY